MAALTTIFTPPASCFNNQYTPFAGDQSILVKDTAIASAECYPTSFDPLFASSVPYSPGVCPAGYTAETRTAYADDATAAICCPTSWTVYPSGLGCSSILTTSTVLSLPTGLSMATSGVELAMHAFYVAWASSDLADFTPASAPLLGAATAATPSSKLLMTTTNRSPSSIASSTTISTSSSTSFPTARSTASSSTTSEGTSKASVAGLVTTTSSMKPLKSSTSSTTASSPSDVTQPAEDQRKQGLSKGAQAGIGTGVALAGLLIIAAAIWLWRRRQNKRRSRAELEAHSESVCEEFVAGPPHKKHISELSGNGETDRSTLEGTSISTPAELDNGPTWDPPRRSGA